MAKEKYLRARVGAEIEEIFTRVATEREKTKSALLLDLVKDFLDTIGELPTNPDPAPPKAGVVSTRINAAEAKKLSEILKTEDKNKSEFLLCLIRARLNKAPHFSYTELNNLREANMHLLAIGRNLNQMVRAIHAGNADKKQFSERYANNLKEHIAEQTRAISNLIKRNLERDCKV